jgi:hypothetical protein
MLHKLRGAMIAPERELLKGEVEIDEFSSVAARKASKAIMSAERRRCAAWQSRFAGAARDESGLQCSPTHPDQPYWRSRRPPRRKGQSSTPMVCSPTGHWQRTATTTVAGRRPVP